MRKILFLLLLLPFFSSAQINRSATEFAKENIREYLVTRIFKDQPYKPVSYGELKPWKGTHSEISWTLDHDFEIAEIQNNKKTTVRKLYKFLFYLDRKMKVVRAESYQVN
jgi:hypothetical protein